MSDHDKKKPRRFRQLPRLLIVCCSLLWLAPGCGDPEADGDGDGDADADADIQRDSEPYNPLDADCNDPGLRVLRVNPWPGDGLQIVVELRDGDGLPVATADLENLMVSTNGETELTRSVATVEIDSGVTAIVVVPSTDSDVHEERLEAAAALIEALPPGERIGLWRADGDLDLLADLTVRHGHVSERLGTLGAGDGAHPGNNDLEKLVEEISEVEGPLDSPSRFIIVVGDPDRDIELDESMALVLRTDGEASTLQPLEGRNGWGGERTPAEAARELADHIADLRASIAVVGLCDTPRNRRDLQVSFDDASCVFEIPDSLWHMAESECDAESAARDEFPFGESVDIVLSSSEMAVWDRRNEDSSEAPFTLHLKIGESAPIKAVASFRGQTSLECRRKSLNVDLGGHEPFPLAPRAAAAELYLISMCKDSGYYQQVLANRFMRKMGLFPLEFRFVDLRLNDVSRGVYLLLEKPTHTLRRSMTDVDRVVRRRAGHERWIEAEVEYPNPSSDEEEEELLAEFHELAALVDTTAPDMIYDVLSQRMDLDNYLRWLAFNTLLRNGDYVDEAIFYASTEGVGDASELYFRTMGWDHDDLNSACHHDGSLALIDPHGIVYCAEDEIDLALIVSDDVYGRYIDHLELLIEETLTDEILEAELVIVREQLFSVLDEDEICAAMTELRDYVPENPSCADVRGEIDGRMDGFLAAIAARRVALVDLIEAWRSER